MQPNVKEAAYDHMIEVRKAVVKGYDLLDGPEIRATQRRMLDLIAWAELIR